MIANTGNDQKWTAQGVIPFGTALLSIKTVQMGECQGHDRIILIADFWVDRQAPLV
jgi:hypothetical protein